ncbi:FliH/SctL family protein [Microbacterium sp. XT11]|uniref:FliH/SctL family protein n=1 Tax=Microbacterium sp. XT11 TaxID=367477 RepID=UPI000831C11A|nr:hypothetical protein [Microbacterium sp. XT11]
MHEPAFTPLAVPRVGAVPIDLRGEADRARTRGYAEGYAEGRRIGLEEARRRASAEEAERRRVLDLQARALADAATALRAAHDAVARRIDELTGPSAARIEELALELASCVVGAELSDPARAAAHALRRALDAMPVERWTRVAFAEREHRLILDDPVAAPLLAGIDVIASPDVDPGGAIVDIDQGAVDTRIGRAFARAAAALRGDDGEVVP